MSRDPILAANRPELVKPSAIERGGLPERISADPESVENGLAKLVLSIIELVRQLLEKQALRRMDAGNLSDEEIERLGASLLKLDEKMAEMRGVFGLTEKDLKLSLGPIRTIE